MDDLLNKEFYINVAVTMLLTLATILSNFNFDLTVIMAVSWFFFIVIHSVKLFGAINSNNNIKIEDMEKFHSIGK